VPIPAEERAELFLELERAAGTGACVWEPGQRLLWSDGFFRLHGIEPDAIRRASTASELFFERVHADDREYLREQWAKAARGEMTTTRYRVVRADGSLRHLRGQGTVTRGGDGVLVRIIGTIVDVTDLQEAIGELACTNVLLTESQLAAGVGSYAFEPASGRLQWSEALYRIYGLEPTEPPTREFIRCATVAEDRERQEDWTRRLQEGEPVAPLSLRILRADGSLRHTETRGRRLVDPNGVVRIVGVCLDVSSRVELETRLHQDAKMEAVGTLAAGVAHDFNNYLTVILCQLEELRQLATPTLQAPLDDAHHAAEQCALLTEKLLAFARKQPPAQGGLELSEVLLRAEPLLRRACGAGVTVTVELPRSPVHVRAEASQLESLLVNLALNARDAMPDGGRLDVAVQEVELASGSVALDPGGSPGRYARIRVSDSGSGIAPEHLLRIFEPYFSTKTSGQGTGLGLASAYGSVRQHGGSIRVESPPGQGTTFDVFLPSASGGNDANGPKAPGPEALLAGRHVLVVEDVDVVRRTVVAGLSRAGARVTAMTDGWHALEFLSGGIAVDAVLTDLIMPRMGGLELARELDRLYPTLPIVFMSGYADHEVVESILRDRPNQPLLRKPFSIKELTDALAGALGRRA
jgi:two-component system cell cycle sensor histidine kinase/response regulator CckA